MSALESIHLCIDQCMIDFLAARDDRQSLSDRIIAAPALAASARAGTLERVRDAVDGYLAADTQRLFHPLKTQTTLGFYHNLKAFGPLANKTVLDFGCGTHEALAISITLWASGAKAVIALDQEAIQWPALTARFLYDWIIHCITEPDRYLWPDVSREHFVARLTSLGLAQLKAGQLEQLYASLPLRHLCGPAASLSTLPDGSLSYVLSQSVMEHIQRPSEVLAVLYQKMTGGGLLCFAIDYRDHRVYVEGASPWQYLVDDGDYLPGYINKLRHNAMLEIFTAQGFRLVSGQLVRQEVPASIMAQCLPKYRNLTSEDLETVAAYLIFQRT